MNDKEYIKEVVENFYEKAINDFMIGYHFRKIQQHSNNPNQHPLQSKLGQFSHHLPRIIEFWEIQLIGKSASEVTPAFDLIKVHQQLSVRKGEVNRWVILFFETLENLPEHKLKQEWVEKIKLFQNIFMKKLF